MKKLTIFFVTAVMAFGFIGCKKTSQGQAAATTVKIAYPNWAAEVAITNLAKVALEDHGYKASIIMLEPGPIYASLAKGDVDLLLGAWLPNTHAAYWEEYGADIEKIGTSYAGGTTGIVVPSYVAESSLEDLAAAKDKYDGKIIGIGSGAGIHGTTEKMIKAYNLPYEQITSSGPAMVASLEKAIQQKKPVAVTGWKPHYMWDRFDLKYLDDPKGVYPKDSANILSRQGFVTDHPELGKFFKNFFMEDKLLYSLMDVVKDAPDELEAARKWYGEHKDYMDKMWK